MQLSGGRERDAHALGKLQRLVLVNHAGHCGGEGRAAAGSLGAGEIRREDGEERLDKRDWGFHFRASHRPVNHHRCCRRVAMLPPPPPAAKSNDGGGGMHDRGGRVWLVTT